MMRGRTKREEPFELMDGQEGVPYMLAFRGSSS